MIVKSQCKEMVKMAEGVERKVLAHDKDLMVVEVRFKKGAVVPPHAHPHKQISYMVSGKMEFELDGSKAVMTTGDSCYMAPNQPHGVTALEDSVVLDTFTPMREDFIE